MGNIYTKKGDKGETSLFGGKRVSKNSLKVDCYGTIDEANSMLGLVFALSDKELLKNIIHKIQQKLFVVGAELASDENGMSMLENKVNPEDIAWLEKTIDECYEVSGKQTEFVIPGANKTSATLHVARTIIRRAERKITTLNETESVRDDLLKYINRLSDAIYALARLEETYVEIDKTKNIAIDIIKKKLKVAEENNMKSEFTLGNIKKMAEFAEEKAKDLKVPIVFTAVDNGGNLILLHRMKNSLLGSIDISINKAYTANALKITTHELSKLANPGGSLYGIENTNNGRIVIFGGGFPYIYENEVVGAIGISGGSVEEDTSIGLYVFEKLRKGR